MSTGGTAPSRRWVGSLPVLVALLFAAVGVAVPTDSTHAPGSGHAAAAPKGLTAPKQSWASGMRPDAHSVPSRGGSWTPAPDVAVDGWAPTHRRPASGWRLVRDARGGWRTGIRQQTYQGRAPPDVT